VGAAQVHALDEAPEQAEAEAKRVATLELTRLESGVNLLSFLAQVSPLLGLLGTVLGMVEMFMGLQEAGEGNVAISDLASGIWKALLTTAAGLTVAVPALAGYAYLVSRVDQVRLQIVDIVQRVTFAAGRARGG
jgi:biopolymer transport protein ExbB